MCVGMPAAWQRVADDVDPEDNGCPWAMKRGRVSRFVFCIEISFWFRISCKGGNPQQKESLEVVLAYHQAKLLT
ncbi:hypothetical protein AV530_012723 [Patagioenas fasciata monilis]|uniref:Uncharacterized protein n=1 Tax=Patagioenas fasciata monilis TaxID=372326 RepID=A0A1V4JCC3_PATFA|nr:hypothetical protein AV530_012723 [Patagioenas fasciata monilis]